MDRSSRISRRMFLVVAIGVCATALADDPKPSAEDINEKVVEFAKSKRGERVGSGQCTSLAVEAMKAAGARRYPPAGKDADYVWGTPVEKWGDARPGDIVQFRDAVFKGKETVREDGRRTVKMWRHTYPHHTAVVLEAMPKARALKILHQNVGDDAATRQTVQEGMIRLGDLQKGGVVKIYRPVAAAGPDEDR